MRRAFLLLPLNLALAQSTPSPLPALAQLQAVCQIVNALSTKD